MMKNISLSLLASACMSMYLWEHSNLINENARVPSTNACKSNIWCLKLLGFETKIFFKKIQINYCFWKTSSHETIEIRRLIDWYINSKSIISLFLNSITSTRCVYFSLSAFFPSVKIKYNQCNFFYMSNNFDKTKACLFHADFFLSSWFHVWKWLYIVQAFFMHSFLHDRSFKKNTLLKSGRIKMPWIRNIF